MIKRTNSRLKLKVGRLLIAQPFLPDSYFTRSVILIGQHDYEGSVGFILNKPTEFPINDALEDFPEIEANLYFGGPVQTDTIHFIHRFKNIPGSKELSPGVYWGGDLEILKQGIASKKIEADDIMFFAGYSGWEEGQLEEEKTNKAWFVSENKPEFMFSDNACDLWGYTLKSIGSNYAILANFPVDPSLN